MICDTPNGSCDVWHLMVDIMCDAPDVWRNVWCTWWLTMWHTWWLTMCGTPDGWQCVTHLVVDNVWHTWWLTCGYYNVWHDLSQPCSWWLTWCVTPDDTWTKYTIFGHVYVWDIWHCARHAIKIQFNHELAIPEYMFKLCDVIEWWNHIHVFVKPNLVIYSSVTSLPPSSAGSLCGTLSLLVMCANCSCK